MERVINVRLLPATALPLIPSGHPSQHDDAIRRLRRELDGKGFYETVDVLDFAPLAKHKRSKFLQRIKLPFDCELFTRAP